MRSCINSLMVVLVIISTMTLFVEDASVLIGVVFVHQILGEDFLFHYLALHVLAVLALVQVLQPPQNAGHRCDFVA